MAGRVVDKLSDITIRNAKARIKSYKLSDGRGLYIEVMPSSSKYWRLKYRFGGKEKRLALGVYPEIKLKDARKAALEAREHLSNGIDPSDRKRQQKLQQTINAVNSFKAVAEEWFKKEEPHWSESHAKRNTSLLNNNLYPWLSHRPISEVTAPELLQALRKTESRGTIETANRAKQVAGRVFRYAVATGRAERDPSNDLKGALQTPKKRHLASITNPKEVKQLLLAIDEYKGSITVETALKLSPLLFVRPGELRHMEWQEINWDLSRWEIPAEKMKTKQPHIIPLCEQAKDFLRIIETHTQRSIYVLPSARSANRPMSENGVRTALRAMGYTNDQMTPHGFRAMARTLLDEVLGYRIEWIEHQLAHSVKDANGRAYNRTTYLEQRTKMMQHWADYLDGLKAGDNVISGRFEQNTQKN